MLSRSIEHYRSDPPFLLKKLGANAVMFWTLGSTPLVSMATMLLQLPLLFLFVRTAVGRHAGECTNPFDTLRCLGGWDIAAMAGFILGAAQCRLATAVDGFVSGASALVARSLAPDSLDAVLVAHESHDPANALLHSFLRVEPYLNLHLHPDSGYAAALLLGIMDAAIQMIDVLPAMPQAAR